MCSQRTQVNPVMAAGSAGGGTGATDPDWDDDAATLSAVEVEVVR